MSRVATFVPVVFKRDEKDVSADRPPEEWSLMSSVNDIDGVYYRISKSWPSLPRQDKQVALINLERLEAQADELGSAGKAVGAEIRALREIIQLAME